MTELATKQYKSMEQQDRRFVSVFEDDEIPYEVRPSLHSWMRLIDSKMSSSLSCMVS